MTRNLSVVLLAAMLGAGCMPFSDHYFRPVRQELGRQLPELELEKEFAISLGAAAFALADALMAGAGFDFSKLENLQLAVYNIKSPVAVSDLDVRRSLTARNPDLDWDVVVRLREADGDTWILSGIDPEHHRVEAISVMSLERDELVLINASGNLEQLLAFAFSPVGDRPGNLHLN